RPGGGVRRHAEPGRRTAPVDGCPRRARSAYHAAGRDGLRARRHGRRQVLAARQRSLTDRDRSIGEELAGWGKVALVETVGRVSGAAVTAAGGFVEGDDGTLHVAAGSESSDWAQNLKANPICQVTIGDRVARFDAVEEDEAGRAST